MAEPRDVGEQDDESGPDEIGVDQHLSPAPTIKEHARERTYNRVGQEENREGQRDANCVRFAFRGEQYEGGECCLDHSVTELADEAYAVQLAEVTASKNRTQVSSHEAKAICIGPVVVQPVMSRCGPTR